MFLIFGQSIDNKWRHQTLPLNIHWHICTLLTTLAACSLKKPPSFFLGPIGRPISFRSESLHISFKGTNQSHKLIKFLRRVINNWFNFALHWRVYSTVYSVLSECLWKKNFRGDSGGIRTHDLLLTSADVLISPPPSMPDDDWPARILYSSGFRDIYRLMKFLHQVINNWFNFALHRRVYSTVYSVLSECLWEKKLHRRLGRDSNTCRCRAKLNESNKLGRYLFFFIQTYITIFYSIVIILFHSCKVALQPVTTGICTPLQASQ